MGELKTISWGGVRGVGQLNIISWGWGGGGGGELNAITYKLGLDEGGGGIEKP